ncbi:hypothetical protein Cadr_000022358 [Camelus dromedarius]|uniref:Uncharacterized protein n=1 Tax=Camelus dromedarius TaxID=9838 RepID=A0A5N4CR77_CAMDR|nr:hypothetical protein Cadr_000022358 [Camelus dromedarius]
MEAGAWQGSPLSLLPPPGVLRHRAGVSSHHTNEGPQERSCSSPPADNLLEFSIRFLQSASLKSEQCRGRGFQETEPKGQPQGFKCELETTKGKKDGSLYFFSYDVVGLATAPGLHKTVRHLDPGVCTPPGDKILGGIWDFLLSFLPPRYPTQAPNLCISLISVTFPQHTHTPPHLILCQAHMPPPSRGRAPLPTCWNVLGPTEGQFQDL